MVRSWFLCVTLVVAASALSGCTKQDITGPETENVRATDNQFSPNQLELLEDDEIKVTNEGDARHSVTVHKGGDPFTETQKDTDIPAGTSTSFTFDEAGTYHVYCKYHSAGATGSFGTGMVLTVTVEAN